ncbi:MAG TPA: filamentous hemagglutinin N-terminal domain-containing protein, partial [Nitrosomonas sp.]|nr:filamentous hemagglutinin N-terminal domain-containing protein [Nitrosomonas sp.]
MKKLLAIYCVLLALLAMQSAGQANNTQILTDSSLSGIGGIEINATGSGQIYTLSELNGKLASDNLFYSFSQFNIGSSDTVWFNLNTPDLAQVISRVTAGNPSYFDGQLK